ncbi:hypothetical protein ACRRTK_015685 [Alexandromys fortis]
MLAECTDNGAELKEFSGENKIANTKKKTAASRERAKAPPPLNAGKAEGFCAVQRAHSTDTSVAGCLQGFSESGVDEEVCITKVQAVVLWVCKEEHTWMSGMA